MEKPLVDLILLSWNHPEVTRPCIETILANTTVPSRLIIVDQGSGEETKKLLRTFQSTPCIGIEILWNPENVGYPKGMNQGLSYGKAPYVCFLNNDILAPPGWLSALIAVAESDVKIGLVNPASNTFGIRPRLGSDWLSLAKSRTALKGRWTEVKYAEGFCILSKREIVEQVGGFDELAYKQIYFEDADLSRKIQALGLRCVMAEGTYVWHHEGQTMGRHPSRLALFRENERRFVARWGRGQRVLYALQGNGSKRLSELYEQARSEANRSGDVWIFTKDAGEWKKLPRHLNIRIKEIQPPLLPWATLWKVLTKKKRFDLIRTDAAVVAQLLKGVRFLHRAHVESLVKNSSWGKGDFVRQDAGKT